jgi:hypothetical protein
MVALLRAPALGPVTEAHQVQFLALLPTIRRRARRAFCCERPEQREELVQRVITTSYAMFAQLVQRGKADLAFATPLSDYAIRQTRTGRQLGAKLNRQDVSSPYAQRFHGLRLERLDQIDGECGDWRETLVEDRRSGPAETAIARLDFAAWWHALPTRLRWIAEALAMGETTANVARQFKLTAGRVSQLRRELMESWERFQQQNVEQSDTPCPA